MSGLTVDGVQLNFNNGLLVYLYPYSYYSHKVLLALHEKRLPFESHIIDLTKGCQFEPWFLKLNPRGEVPVLQDTGKIIPDSTRIIDYLEDNFSNGSPRLIPLDQGSEIKQKVVHFRSIIDEIPARTLTYGSLMHSDLVRWARPPFLGPARTLLLRGDRNTVSLFKKHADLNTEARDVLMQKAIVHEENSSTLTNKDKYLKVLEQVNNVLTEVEDELAKNSNSEDRQDWWLCSDRFTVADICLTVLLERLSQLGYEYRFWRNGKRPFTEKYYLRAQQRRSYKLTIPGPLFHVKMFVVTFKKPLIISIIGIALVSVAVAGGFFIIGNSSK